jgi:hypothetical protein
MSSIYDYITKIMVCFGQIGAGRSWQRDLRSPLEGDYVASIFIIPKAISFHLQKALDMFLIKAGFNS